MRPLAILILSLCAACAGESQISKQFAKPGASEAQVEQDRLQCQSIMYSERTAKGKGAPNWNRFEYCMKQRGYVRTEGKVSG
jgi:hypothetical protein